MQNWQYTVLSENDYSSLLVVLAEENEGIKQIILVIYLL